MRLIIECAHTWQRSCVFGERAATSGRDPGRSRALAKSRWNATTASVVGTRFFRERRSRVRARTPGVASDRNPRFSRNDPGIPAIRARAVDADECRPEMADSAWIFGDPPVTDDTVVIDPHVTSARIESFELPDYVSRRSPAKRRDLGSLGMTLVSTASAWTAFIVAVLLLSSRRSDFFHPRVYSPKRSRNARSESSAMDAISWLLLLASVLESFAAEWNTQDYMKREHSLIRPYQGSSARARLPVAPTGIPPSRRSRGTLQNSLVHLLSNRDRRRASPPRVWGYGLADWLMREAYYFPQIVALKIRLRLS